ncbi:DDE_3 domain-containing protein [Trichonephila clavipes]|nr:DDE_3 domain-containing protein [Trichonephila clavipes]
MNWPAYSPDLNPIEHVWDMLGRRIAARQPPPTCLPELRRALFDEWCNIPQDQIDNLILSMPRLQITEAHLSTHLQRCPLGRRYSSLSIRMTSGSTAGSHFTLSPEGCGSTLVQIQAIGIDLQVRCPGEDTTRHSARTEAVYDE